MKDIKGFTLIELLIVISIIGLTASIALPNFYYSKEAAVFTSCVRARQVIEQAEGQFLLEHDRHSYGVTSELISEGYLNPDTHCPSGAPYYRRITEDGVVIGCLLHGFDKNINVNLIDPEGSGDVSAETLRRKTRTQEWRRMITRWVREHRRRMRERQ